ncbi:Golgi-resident adenosine 3',5'-bisphosphate 3'-phosphatase [Spea bombifrons]|uniref:Golgi-resident adenosine 3',5'-bisphosphate 3'-phosphatase n=1 Tax=Spea bombifrons TaxID=233779 RepID=UPI00234B8986|nr:Golgi-resident adenosine 3',5'-bisphosphate 3'-phosphatase [Spea bombifrons]
MAPMGIRLSPLGIGVFCLLALGVLYHVYSGFLTGRFSAFLLGDPEDSGADGFVDLRELLAVAVKAAELGGVEVKKVRESNLLNEKKKGKTKEGADDKMTRGDLLSNKKMFHLIQNAFPGVQVNTEEVVDADDQEAVSWDRKIPDDIMDVIKSSISVSTDSITIWIDPLDATFEYTENLVTYVTTMVCVAVNGKPVIGVIHKPFSGYTAWAMVDSGSNVKKRSSYNDKTPTIIVSRSHSGVVKDVTRETFGNQTTIISAGGSGYKVLSLLDVTEEGQEHADVYIHVTFIKKWDICAGNAILRALGGRMTTLKGEDIVYTGSDGNEGGLLASIGMDHDALVKKLAEKLPAFGKKSQK